MEKKKSVCLNCGKDITQKQHQRKNYQYKYCSRYCSSDARYGKTIAKETIEARNPLYLEAAKLLEEGLTQTEAAERAGINKNTLSSWLHRHGAKNSAAVFANCVCQHCGVSLADMPCLSRRKYCSVSCGNKARYRQKPSSRPNKLWQHERSVFEGAMEMYWNGTGGSAIARHFGIPVGTVLSWIHDFGGQKERLEPLKNRLRLAKNADEWNVALRENTPKNNDEIDDSTVILVCGNVNGHSGVSQLCGVISERLKSDPLSGEVFVFCNKERNIITTFSWKKPVFNITKHIKMHWTFIWPDEELGAAIEAAVSEFEYLISCCKQDKYFAENA